MSPFRPKKQREAKKVNYSEEINTLNEELLLLQEQLVSESDPLIQADWEKEILRVTEALEFKREEKLAYDELLAEGKLQETPLKDQKEEKGETMEGIEPTQSPGSKKRSRIE